MIGMSKRRKKTQYSRVKRALDVVISAMALLAIWPLLLVLALLVKMDGGPAFFVQSRVGRHGRLFKLYKFRSMYSNAEEMLKDLLDEMVKNFYSIPILNTMQWHIVEIINKEVIYICVIINNSS